jgi:hypothetical protein
MTYCELPIRFLTPNREFVDMMSRNLAQSLYSLHDAWILDFLLCFKTFAENVSVYFFRRPRSWDSQDSPTSFTALLASNLLAQFSRQIVIQILSLESPKVCRNLAVHSFKLLEYSNDPLDTHIFRPSFCSGFALLGRTYFNVCLVGGYLSISCVCGCLVCMEVWGTIVIPLTARSKTPMLMGMPSITVTMSWINNYMTKLWSSKESSWISNTFSGLVPRKKSLLPFKLGVYWPAHGEGSGILPPSQLIHPIRYN